ncbi:hypothetical protein BDK89_0976 [Ilumatobacter fluminis]|uniref:Uncharacterized protein n=2 Tax=Ilumatobacter fluminis TaxID=467091 RepID=A0A4R7HYT5_9ACTN|nr:hypothetical protein BDK89_0976 [Ilumatobacter fluminis]
MDKTDDTMSGMRVGVRAATFGVGGEQRSAVMLTVVVSDGHFNVVDGGVAATVLLNPDEAAGIAEWLREAVRAADSAAPPMYGGD